MVAAGRSRDTHLEEREIAFSSGGIRLAGTLAPGESPSRSACVLMVPGSGQVDRNENHRRLPLNVFAELARHLAARGFDTVRYDKRGVGDSQGDFWTAGLHDNASDVAAAVAYIRSGVQVDAERIFLLGHSEGAYLATMVAAKTPGLSGLVLLAGGARRGEDELRWQAGQIADSLTGFSAFLVRAFHIDLLKTQQKQLEKIKRSRKDSYRARLLARVNAKWMREFLAYDPSADLAKVAVPILAVIGTKDIQVDPGNLERMSGLVTVPLECHLVPEVTHLLRADPGPPRLSSYKEQVRRPLDRRLVDIILAWLEQQAGIV